MCVQTMCTSQRVYKPCQHLRHKYLGDKVAPLNRVKHFPEKMLPQCLLVQTLQEMLEITEDLWQVHKFGVEFAGGWVTGEIVFH